VTVRDMRNVPAEVLDRLAGIDAATFDTVQRGRRLEARPLSQVELRTDDNGAEVLRGYATVYEHAYDIAGGPPYGWSETIADGAAAKSVRERDDVRLLVNHEGIALGRTRSNTLRLESDETGLLVESTLDPASPLAQSLASAMRRGDMDEMSFAFQVLRQEWNDDYTERRIIEVRLFDVSVVTYPANPATLVGLRDAAPVNDEVRRSAYPLSLALAEAERMRLRK
jgi:HK97 family phage prohead protease